MNKKKIRPPCRSCAEPTSPTAKTINTYCDACIKKRVFNTKPPEDLQSSTRIRVYLLRTRPHQCEDCKLEQWKGVPIPLDVDHIDGNGDNNDHTNLRLICPNCHALTPTYKGKNRGNGSSRQAARRKRYACGQTY